MTSASTTTAASTHHSHEGGPLDSDDDGCTDGEAVGAGVAAVRVGEVGGAVCVGEVRGAVSVGEVRGAVSVGEVGGAVCVGVGATTITDDLVGLGSACAGADVRVGAGGDGGSVSSGVRVRSGTSGDAGVRVGSGTVAVGDGNPLAVRVTVGEGRLTSPFPPQEPRSRAASASPAIRTINGNHPALPDPARLATAPPPAFG